MSLSINNKLNITLCGMMGSGKTAIGKSPLADQYPHKRTEGILLLISIAFGQWVYAG